MTKWAETNPTNQDFSWVEQETLTTNKVDQELAGARDSIESIAAKNSPEYYQNVRNMPHNPFYDEHRVVTEAHDANGGSDTNYDHSEILPNTNTISKTQ